MAAPVRGGGTFFRFKAGTVGASGSRVLNHLTGHADSRTRERIYQDPNNERVRARAAEARRSMRNYLRGDVEGRERLAA